MTNAKVVVQDLAKPTSSVIANVVGSYDHKQSEVSFGAVLLYKGEEINVANTSKEPEHVTMRGLAGEILGAEKVLAFAIENGAEYLTIHHHFGEVAKFCTGELQAQEIAAKAYNQYFDKIKGNITVTFIHVERDAPNEAMQRAGKLAEAALIDSKLKSKIQEESFDVTQATGFKLVGHLNDVKNVQQEVTVLVNPERVKYRFSTSLENDVQIIVYATGQLVLQGVPAKLYLMAKDYVLKTLSLQQKDHKFEFLSIYEERGKLLKVIQTAGNSLWNDFVLESFIKHDNFTRCIFTTNKKRGTLDFHYGKHVGSITMIPVSKNMKLSQTLSETIYKQSRFKDDGVSKSHPMQINRKTAEELIVFLSELKGIKKESAILGSPEREQFAFISARGDRLYVNVFQDEKIILQGKPAYLFSEAMSFLSNYSEVTIEDVVAANNSFFEVDINVADTRTELQQLMPNAYGNIDDTIIKLLSPAISLKRVSIELEDFSSFAFPVLLALEGYLKFLFSVEEIKIDQHFGEVFAWNVVKGKHQLKPFIRKKLKQPNREDVLVEVYDYFREHRHAIFHADQELEESRIIETKAEADEIVSEVIDLIERTYTKFIT